MPRLAIFWSVELCIGPLLSFQWSPLQLSYCHAIGASMPQLRLTGMHVFNMPQQEAVRPAHAEGPDSGTSAVVFLG